MSTKKIQWADVESDEDSDLCEQCPIAKQQVKYEDSNNGFSRDQRQQQHVIRDKNEMRKIREEQRIIQIKKLDELNSEEVWMFIYKKSNSSDLENCINQLDCIKKMQNSVGWEVKVSKEEARDLIINGFRHKRVFTNIQVAKRNYNDGDRRDKGRFDKEEKKRYVQKGSQRQQEENVITSEFTFQKKKKPEREKNSEDIGKQREKQKQKEKKSYNIYRDNPIYQGLGDFRNKQAPNKQKIQNEEDKQTIKEQQSKESFDAERTEAHKITRREDNKPRYAQKEKKPRYKQKPRKPSIEVEAIQKLAKERQNHVEMIIEDPEIQSVQAPKSQQRLKQNQIIQATKIIKSSTHQSSPISGQSSVQASQEGQNQLQIQTKEEKSSKTKKKRRQRNKQPKPVVISNNPFDKLK